MSKEKKINQSAAVELIKKPRLPGRNNKHKHLHNNQVRVYRLTLVKHIYTSAFLVMVVWLVNPP